MRTTDLVIAAAIGLIVAKTCCNKSVPICPPPPKPIRPCPKCVYKRYYGCNG